MATTANTTGAQINPAAANLRSRKTSGQTGVERPRKQSSEGPYRDSTSMALKLQTTPRQDPVALKAETSTARYGSDFSPASPTTPVEHLTRTPPSPQGWLQCAANGATTVAGKAATFTGEAATFTGEAAKVVREAATGSGRFKKSSAMFNAVNNDAVIPRLYSYIGIPKKADKDKDGRYVKANGETVEPGTDINGLFSKKAPRKHIHVNGIMTTLAYHLENVKQTQDTQRKLEGDPHYEVVGMHNATEGFDLDLIQCAGDKLDLFVNLAVDSLAKDVHKAVMSGEPLFLDGHSQGGLIISRALCHVEKRLLEEGLSKEEVKKRLSVLDVETSGAASMYYPDGPRYVHYINTYDPTPNIVGLGLVPAKLASVLPSSMNPYHPGEGAAIIKFSAPYVNPDTAHSVELYNNNKMRFDKAHAEGSCTLVNVRGVEERPKSPVISMG